MVCLSVLDLNCSWSTVHGRLSFAVYTSIVVSWDYFIIKNADVRMLAVQLDEELDEAFQPVSLILVDELLSLFDYV
jgi:hypothetical protein